MTTVLRLQKISKRFPGVQALKTVSMGCEAGEIHAIVGENGSGKTTLLSIASGALSADSGTVEIMGDRLRQAHPAGARRMGLATVYQDNSLILELSVAQNLYLSAPPGRRPRYRELTPWARKIIDRYALDLDPKAVVGELSLAKRQFLEVIKALLSRPKVLLLDEPTTALGPGDVAHLQNIIREVASQSTGVLYVSHRLPEVLELANRVTILRDGQSQGTFPTEGLSQEGIISLMVGTSLDMEFPAKPEPEDGREVVLSVDGLSGASFGPVDLTVRRGEIVGLAGAEGNGQREMLRALAGFEPASGHMTFRGKRMRLNSPTAALKSGILLLSGDRARESIFPVLGVRHNMTVQTLHRFGKLGVMAGNRERAAAAALVQELKITTPSLEQPVRFLSGGNQQKTVLSRAFLNPSGVLLVDEPTQGVDAKARLDIYRALRAKADEGVALVINSSDALEMSGLCDRVLVISRGQVTREIRGAGLTEENIVASFLTSDARRTHVEQRPAAEEAPVAGQLGPVAALFPQPLKRVPALFKAEWTPLWVLALLIIAIGLYTSFQSSAFSTTLNMRHLMLATVPLALVAMAQLNVLLLGGFDVSVGSMMSLTVVIASFVIAPGDPTIAIIGGVAACLAAGLAVGVLNGTMVRGLRIAPIIATIATLSILQGIALIFRNIPGGPISGDFVDVVTKRVDFIPIAFIVVVGLAILADVWLHHTGSGLTVRAVGYREEAARRVGISTAWMHFRGYILAAVIAAIAGLFLSTQVGVGHPTVGSSFTLLSIAAAVLGGASLFGGRGSFLGAILGALFLALTVNILPFLEINTAFGLIAAGGLTLIAILLYSGSSVWSRLASIIRAREGLLFRGA